MALYDLFGTQVVFQIVHGVHHRGMFDVAAHIEVERVHAVEVVHEDIAAYPGRAVFGKLPDEVHIRPDLCDAVAHDYKTYDRRSKDGAGMVMNKRSGTDHEPGKDMVVVGAVRAARRGLYPEDVQADCEQNDGQNACRTQTEGQFDAEVLEHLDLGCCKGEQTCNRGQRTHEHWYGYLGGGSHDIAAFEIMVVYMHGIVGTDGNEQHCDSRAQDVDGKQEQGHQPEGPDNGKTDKGQREDHAGNTPEAEGEDKEHHHEHYRDQNAGVPVHIFVHIVMNRGVPAIVVRPVAGDLVDLVEDLLGYRHFIVAALDIGHQCTEGAVGRHYRVYVHLL